MGSAVAELKHEWRAFKHDRPGERFRNHRTRMQKKSRGHSIVAGALGVLLLAAGVVFLFIPGPGLPLIVFGLALVATHSDRLSRDLDRFEPWLRHTGHRAGHRWRAMSRLRKTLLISACAIGVSAFLVGTWKWVVAAYIL
jgi:uncharacterized membrane protein YbaN (DUF454 family)